MTVGRRRRIAIAACAAGLALVAAGCDSSGSSRSLPPDILDRLPSPTNWRVVQSGSSGGRRWRLVRGTDKGQDCFRFTTTPRLPSPAPLSCDMAANLSGDDGGSPMALEIAHAGHGTGYVFGGVAPELATVTMELEDGTRVPLPTVDRTLVTYSDAPRTIARMRFETRRSHGNCATGTEAATFNCSWYGP